MYEERFKGFRYAASVFDLVQQGKDGLPVMDTSAGVLLLVVVRVDSIPLECGPKWTKKKLN